jgi:hypothetical protein
MPSAADVKEAEQKNRIAGRSTAVISSWQMNYSWDYQRRKQK